MLVSKDFTLEAAHVLPRHPGRCSRLHGHSWLIRVALEGPLHPGTQFVIDYADLSAMMEPIIERWDHRFLNAFIKYPSAENIAAHLAHLIRAQLNSNWFNRLKVSVSETRKTWAVWDSIRREDIMMLDKSPMDAEWRSPEVDIPIDILGVLEPAIKTQDEKVKQLLAALTHEMTLREQYVLYRDTLIAEPEMPPSLRKQDVQ